MVVESRNNCGAMSFEFILGTSLPCGHFRARPREGAGPRGGSGTGYKSSNARNHGRKHHRVGHDRTQQRIANRARPEAPVRSLKVAYTSDGMLRDADGKSFLKDPG